MRGCAQQRHTMASSPLRLSAIPAGVVMEDEIGTGLSECD